MVVYGTIVFTPPLIRKLNPKHMIATIAKIISKILFYTLFFCIGALVYNLIHLNDKMIGAWMMSSVVIAFIILILSPLRNKKDNDKI
jgi:hypothetical protein